LKVAATLFAQRGFESVSIAEIGYESGVTGPAIYRYFTSKEQLLASIFGHLHERFKEGLTAISARRLEGRDAIEALVDLQIDLAMEEPEKIKIANSEWQHLPGAEAAQLREASRGYLDAYLQRVRDVRPDLSPEEVDTTVHGLLALVNSIALRRNLDPPPPKVHRRLRLMALSVVFDAGFKENENVGNSKTGRPHQPNPDSSAR
jgi:AcrR family transcriptional regulator